MVCTKIGDYLLLDTIGEGTFGKVKHAVHAHTGDQFAVKVMEKANIRENSLTLQVRREISVMTSLHHKNVVKLYQVLTSKTRVYIIMDLVTGGELFDEILRWKRLPEDLARFYFLQLVDGLEHCHTRGVYHRDLKPENLLLAENGFLKITDFGLSTLKGSNSEDVLTTQCGTPNYVAPEVITSAAAGYSGAKSDIWSCGIILFVLLAGYLPFDEDDPDVLFAKILACDFVYPDWFSDQVVDMLRHLLRIDVDRRYTIHQVRNHPWCLFQSSGGEVLYAPGPKLAPLDRRKMEDVDFVTDELCTDIPVDGMEVALGLSHPIPKEGLLTPAPQTPRRRRATNTHTTGGESMMFPERENPTCANRQSTPSPDTDAKLLLAEAETVAEPRFPNQTQSRSNLGGEPPEAILIPLTNDVHVVDSAGTTNGEALHCESPEDSYAEAPQVSGWDELLTSQGSTATSGMSGRGVSRRNLKARDSNRGEEIVTELSNPHFAPKEPERLSLKTEDIQSVKKMLRGMHRGTPHSTQESQADSPMKAEDMESVKVMLTEMHRGTTRKMEAAARRSSLATTESEVDPWSNTGSENYLDAGRVVSLNIPSTVSTQPDYKGREDDSLLKNSDDIVLGTNTRTPLCTDTVVARGDSTYSPGAIKEADPAFSFEGLLSDEEASTVGRQSRVAREYERKISNVGALEVTPGRAMEKIETITGRLRSRLESSNNDSSDGDISPWMNGATNTLSRASQTGSVLGDTGWHSKMASRRWRGFQGSGLAPNETRGLRSGSEQLYGVDNPEGLASTFSFALPEIVARGFSSRSSARRSTTSQLETDRGNSVDEAIESTIPKVAIGKSSGGNGKLTDRFKVRNPLHVKRFTQFTSTCSTMESARRVMDLLHEMGAIVKARLDREDMLKIKAEQMYNNSFVGLAIEVYKLSDELTSVSLRKSRTNKADQGVFLDYFKEVYSRFEGQSC